MAKKKPTEPTEAASTESKIKRVSSKPATKKSAPTTAPTKSSPFSAPMIDTSLAAQSAAKMLSAGLAKKNLNLSTQPPRTESAMFKQMKSGLNKPTGSAMNNLLDKTHGPATGHNTHGFTKQQGHNQTVGSDASRTGVPRRTGG